MRAVTKAGMGDFGQGLTFVVSERGDRRGRLKKR
jgi:hypothetical protein